MGRGRRRVEEGEERGKEKDRSLIRKVGEGRRYWNHEIEETSGAKLVYSLCNNDF